MKINIIWCVRDPGPQSQLVDILWSCPVYRVDLYLNPQEGWDAKRCSFYTEHQEALEDAQARLRARDSV